MNNKKFLLVLLILAVAIVGALELKFFAYNSRKFGASRSDLFFIRPVRLGSAFFQVALAVNDAERTKGLSDSDQLKDNQGLLFVFPNDDRWGIWMKDMKYPIDIVWLDQNAKVSFIKENVSPSTYPEVFYPPIPERFVLELPAGTVKNSQIVFGDLLIY